MSLWKIAWRSIEQRSLASVLTGLSMALGVALVVAVLLIHGVIADSFKNNAALGYNMIVTAKGGKLQAVLNTVYYLSSPVENIPYSYYKKFTEGEFAPYIEAAVPLCLGDYYQNFRVVGTTPDMFNRLQYSGKPYRFALGQNFKQSEFFSAVIGAAVARSAGLKVGDEFHPTHGAPGGHQHDPFTIVGILAPTGTPNDRALFVNMEGFYLLEGHAREGEEPSGATSTPAKEHHDEGAAEHASEEHHDEHAEHDEHHAHHDEHEHHHHSHKPLPESQREVTAILLLMRGVGGAPPELMAPSLMKAINKGPTALAILPIREITNLFEIFVQPVQSILIGLSVVVVIVSGLSILVSIYNSMSDRRHEIAVMRALGASRNTVMLIVLLESILLSLGGGLVGWLIGHGLSVALNPWIVERTGMTMRLFQFVPYESVIIPGLVLLAALVGYLPAMAAYRTDVAKSLTATP